jgi:hypothetical protein
MQLKFTKDSRLRPFNRFHVGRIGWTFFEILTEFFPYVVNMALKGCHADLMCTRT